jgi:polyhydroxybutyrate depolymerase
MYKRCGILIGSILAVAAVAVAALPSGSVGHAVINGQLASSPATISPSCRPGDRTIRIWVDGEPHQALLHVPRGASGPMPLLLAFHGAAFGPSFVAKYYGLTPVADRNHFAILYPQASHNTFWQLPPTEHEDVDAVRALLDRVNTFGCIDSSRVYATGASNGGGFSARLGCELADRLAAIAPVAGGYAPLGACNPSRPLPVLEIHGTRDEVVPYGGDPPDHGGSVARFLGEWTDLDRCSGTPRQTTPRRWVTVLVWSNCADGSQVEHIRLSVTDHGWPGGDTEKAGLKNHPIPSLDPTGLNAAQTVWGFLSRFRLPA